MLSVPDFFRGRKMRCSFQITWNGICLSVMPSLKKYRKTQLVLNFLYVATHLLKKYNAQFFHLGLNRKLYTCRAKLFWKIGSFASGVTSQIVQKFWRMRYSLIIIVIQIDSSQPLQVWVRQSKHQLQPLLLQTLVVDPILKPLIMITASKFCLSGSSRKLLLKINYLDYRKGDFP